MKRSRNHWTTTDPAHVRQFIRTNEKKLRNGNWVKVTADKVVHGASRKEVREKAKGAVA